MVFDQRMDEGYQEKKLYNHLFGEKYIMNPIDNNIAGNMFWENCDSIFSNAYPDAKTISNICKAAQLWRNDGHYILSGLATSFATIASKKFGLMFSPQWPAWSNQSVSDYNNCLKGNKYDVCVHILSLFKIHQELIRFNGTSPDESLDTSRNNFSVLTKLAELQIDKFINHEYASKILLEGFRIEGNGLGNWNISINDDISTYNHYDSQKNIFSFFVEPAFEILIATGDYIGAHNISKYFPDSFEDSKLKGWRSAVQAFVNQKETHTLFFEASNYFAQDEPSINRIARGMGEFAHKMSWAPHFHMRGLIALAIHEPSKFEIYFNEAAKIASTPKPISVPSIERYDYLIKTLAGIMEEFDIRSNSDACERFRYKFMLKKEIYDPIILEFIDNSINGLNELQDNRKTGLSKIGKALYSLDRLPLLGDTDREAFGSFLDKKTISILDGETNNWIYEKISSIKNEDIFRKILLRLFQNQIPQYAQIRHGPIEFGKDLAVFIEENSLNILRMYQVKCGDINKQDWKYNCRPQLEEMFQIPMSDFQHPTPIHNSVGILIWNGHFNPYIEDIAKNWKKEQLDVLNRKYEFMNLDSIVNYIIDMRLVNSLRASLAEFNV